MKFEAGAAHRYSTAQVAIDDPLGHVVAGAAGAYLLGEDPIYSTHWTIHQLIFTPMGMNMSDPRCMILDGGRKSEYPKRTHAETNSKRF